METFEITRCGSSVDGEGETAERGLKLRLHGIGERLEDLGLELVTRGG